MLDNFQKAYQKAVKEFADNFGYMPFRMSLDEIKEMNAKYAHTFLNA